MFELQTRGWFFDTFPSVRQNTWKLRLVRNSSAPWPPLIWCGEVTKDGGESIKIQPKKWSQCYNSAPLHRTPKRLPHSDSKVTTVTTRGLKKSPSSVLWKVIASVLFWYLLLLYNLFFQPSELKGVEVPVKCIHSATTCDFKKQIKFIKMTKVSSCRNYVPGKQNAYILKLDYFQRKKMERPGYPGFWMRSTKSK